MTVEMIISQLLFWWIVTRSVFILIEFKKARGDEKLRLLMLELFGSKIWCYGLAAIFYLFWDFNFLQTWDTVLLRILCNLPMMLVMERLYLYVKKHNK